MVPEGVGPGPQYEVDIYGRATAVCDNCNRRITLALGQFKDKAGKFKVQCKCGVAFKATFGFPNAFVKEVKLQGSYTNLRNKSQGDMVIEKLSMDGVGFRMYDEHSVKAGDVVSIEFTLDNATESEVKQQVKVLSVFERYVGAKYVESRKRNATIGFYLMP